MGEAGTHTYKLPVSSAMATEANPVGDAVSQTPEPAPAPASSSPSSPPPPPARHTTVKIIPGYRPGILGRTLEMHLAFYHPTLGWGREFEAGLAKSIGDLLARLDRPVNQAWSAVLEDGERQGEGRIVGVVYVDGECMGREGVARLRCFIVDESARGLGVGGKLLAAAMAFVREEPRFAECRLETMRELTVARRMYERAGFRKVGETWFDEFGKGAMSLEYCWRRDEQS